jgi:hypothetical protein
MNSAHLPLLLWLCVYLLSSCSSIKPYYANGTDGKPATDVVPFAGDPQYSFYLVGGISLQDSSPVLEAIEASAVKKDGLILLGDNLSLDQFPASSMDEIAPDHPIYSKLKSLSSSFKDFYIIPGKKNGVMINLHRR